MAESAIYNESINAELAQQRLLANVDLLLTSRQADGSYPEGAQEGALLNCMTQLEEDRKRAAPPDFYLERDR
jgi:hypothetical protein